MGTKIALAFLLIELSYHKLMIRHYLSIASTLSNGPKDGLFSISVTNVEISQIKRVRASSGQKIMEEMLNVTILVIELTVKITNKFLIFKL